ncbi:MAG TPA: heat-inducible transcription repressor HrcA [Clostridia bacterium]|nr:heat-inducible transcription repressor HrcA [Clostridia bacterium]
MPMDERKQKVLLAIVKDFIATAEPVGSRTIARKYDLGVSPATIRNEMADLEEMGYLEQPHTSAGRIPSDSGYRYYVDCLMEQYTLSEAERNYIKTCFEEKMREIEEIVNFGSLLLSQLSNYTSLTMGPYGRIKGFQQVRLIPVATDKALLIAISHRNIVHHHLLEIPPSLTDVDLARISSVLNSHLQGLAMAEVREKVIEEIYQEFYAYKRILQTILGLLEYSRKTSRGGQVFLSGTLNIFNQPEFKDLDKVKAILGILENKEVLKELLVDAPKEGLTIKIGGENKLEEINECSVVTATYTINGGMVGHLGILGPTRMEYSKAVALVEAIAQNLSEVFSRLYK